MPGHHKFFWISWHTIFWAGRHDKHVLVGMISCYLKFIIVLEHNVLLLCHSRLTKI